MQKPVTTVGVVSDSHKLVRAEVLEALAGVEMILHAGDIGRQEVLDELSQVAETIAIKGNIDRTGTVAGYPDEKVIHVAGRTLYMLHDLNTLDRDPRAEGYDVVISGHSHNPSITEHEGVLYINPGSIGPRRFSLPIALARLSLGASVDAEIIQIEPGASSTR